MENNYLSDRSDCQSCFHAMHFKGKQLQILSCSFLLFSMTLFLYNPHAVIIYANSKLSVTWGRQRGMGLPCQGFLFSKHIICTILCPPLLPHHLVLRIKKRKLWSIDLLTKKVNTALLRASFQMQGMHISLLRLLSHFYSILRWYDLWCRSLL